MGTEQGNKNKHNLTAAEKFRRTVHRTNSSCPAPVPSSLPSSDRLSLRSMVPVRLRLHGLPLRKVPRLVC